MHEREKKARQKYGDNFINSLTHSIKWESKGGQPGFKIPWGDDEFWFGNIKTPSGRKKTGYTDGITGASKHDRGGETKYGFAQKAHRKLVVRDLQFEDVIRLYWELYAVPVRYAELPPKVARVMFDIACGSGTLRAIKMLQKVIGVQVDGVFGNQTIGKALEYIPKQLFDMLTEERANFYRGIVARNPSQQIFLKGWLNRTYDLK